MKSKLIPHGGGGYRKTLTSRIERRNRGGTGFFNNALLEEKRA